MKNNFLRLFLISIMSLCWFSTIRADVILEPDPPTGPTGPTEFATINGTFGLTGYTTAGSAYLSMQGYSTSAPVDANGQFSIQAGAGAPYNLSVSASVSGYNASFSAYQSNASQLTAGEIRTVDWTSDAGMIRAQVTLTGGQLTNIYLWGRVTDSVRDVTFTASAWDALTQHATIKEVSMPSPVGAAVSTSGSITAINDNGCTVTQSLPIQTVAVAAGLTTDVSWTVDVGHVTCDRGNLEGTVGISGLPTGTVTGGSVYAYGAESRSQSIGSDGSYSMSDLRAGGYNVRAYSYLAAPYQFYSHPQVPVTIVGGQTSVQDFFPSVAPTQGTIQLVGPWDLSQVTSASVNASAVSGTSLGASALDQVTLSSGEYDLAFGEGGWRVNNYSFSFNEPSPTPGRTDYSSTYQNNFSDTTVSSDGVTPITLPLRSFDTSETLVIFHVAPDANGVQTPIKTLQINGNGVLKDPVTQANSAYAGIYLNGTGTPAVTLTSKLRGFPGLYNMTAVGYTETGQRYSAAFQLDLGTPENTPTGTNISNTIGSTTVTYENITSPGTTTVSELTLGPPSPEGFVIYPSTTNANSADPLYFDVTTTATYTGNVQVCINYDDTGMSVFDEVKLELGHYVCDANNNCTWTVITDTGYPDTTNNLICGTTTSFSYFAILVPKIVDSDADGLADDADNCPGTPNADQADFDGDGVGDACDSDSDGDGLTDDIDLCPAFPNSVNTDADGDGVGDPCDPDLDNDLIANELDNCPSVVNADQRDFDNDGQGDACDSDDDNDNVDDLIDSCARTPAALMVDDTGCSSYQRFARECPVRADYRNHGHYVSCITKEVEAQLDIGLITFNDAGLIVSSAAHTDIGKKPKIAKPLKKRKTGKLSPIKAKPKEKISEIIRKR